MMMAYEDFRTSKKAVIWLRAIVNGGYSKPLHRHTLATQTLKAHCVFVTTLNVIEAFMHIPIWGLVIYHEWPCAYIDKCKIYSLIYAFCNMSIYIPHQYKNKSIVCLFMYTCNVLYMMINLCRFMFAQKQRHPTLSQPYIDSENSLYCNPYLQITDGISKSDSKACRLSRFWV